MIHKPEKNQMCLLLYHEHKEKNHQHEYDIHHQTNTAPEWPNAELQLYLPEPVCVQFACCAFWDDTWRLSYLTNYISVTLYMNRTFEPSFTVISVSIHVLLHY
jgi:hypothetical protein